MKDRLKQLRNSATPQFNRTCLKMTNKATKKKYDNGRTSINGEEVHVMTIVHNEQAQIVLEISLSANV